MFLFCIYFTDGKYVQCASIGDCYHIPYITVQMIRFYANLFTLDVSIPANARLLPNHMRSHVHLILARLPITTLITMIKDNHKAAFSSNSRRA